jgi:hypothetical protein
VCAHSSFCHLSHLFISLCVSLLPCSSSISLIKFSDDDSTPSCGSLIVSEWYSLTTLYTCAWQIMNRMKGEEQDMWIFLFEFQSSALSISFSLLIMSLILFLLLSRNPYIFNLGCLIIFLIFFNHVISANYLLTLSLTCWLISIGNLVDL